MMTPKIKILLRPDAIYQQAFDTSPLSKDKKINRTITISGSPSFQAYGLNAHAVEFIEKNDIAQKPSLLSISISEVSDDYEQNEIEGNLVYLEPLQSEQSSLCIDLMYSSDSFEKLLQTIKHIKKESVTVSVAIQSSEVKYDSLKLILDEGMWPIESLSITTEND